MTHSPSAIAYSERDTLRAARALYFERYGFGDGGYDAKWVALNSIGPIPVGFPNSAARVRAVKLHDLHHVLTGYAADYAGEAEISAWELGAGCGRHLAAWLINAGGIGYGIVLSPRAVIRAYARGRRSRSLYERAELDEALLERSVGDVRRELGLAGEAQEPAASDVAFALAFGAAGIALYLAPIVLVALGLFTALR